MGHVVWLLSCLSLGKEKKWACSCENGLIYSRWFGRQRIRGVLANPHLNLPSVFNERQAEIQQENRVEDLQLIHRYPRSRCIDCVDVYTQSTALTHPPSPPSLSYPFPSPFPSFAAILLACSLKENPIITPPHLIILNSVIIRNPLPPRQPRLKLPIRIIRHPRLLHQRLLPRQRNIHMITRKRRPIHLQHRRFPRRFSHGIMPFDLFIAPGEIVAPLVGAHLERTIIERLDTEILDEIHACVRRVRIRSIAFGGAN